MSTPSEIRNTQPSRLILTLDFMRRYLSGLPVVEKKLQLGIGAFHLSITPAQIQIGSDRVQIPVRVVPGKKLLNLVLSGFAVRDRKLWFACRFDNGKIFGALLDAAFELVVSFLQGYAGHETLAIERAGGLVGVPLQAGPGPWLPVAVEIKSVKIDHGIELSFE